MRRLSCHRNQACALRHKCPLTQFLLCCTRRTGDCASVYKLNCDRWAACKAVAQSVHQALKRLALPCRAKGASGLKEVAMGADQTATALQMLSAAAAAGEWLYLKNIHLVATWLPSLNHAIRSSQPQPGFCLWLSAEPSAVLPTGLLEGCLVCCLSRPACAPACSFCIAVRSLASCASCVDLHLGGAYKGSVESTSAQAQQHSECLRMCGAESCL